MAPNTRQPPLLALRHVTVMRGERAALLDVTLRVEAGEHVCILGPNGCGKSTLIKTITRECYPLANEALARLGITHLAARSGAHMSTGEAKRTLIARALVHEPQTLLFDEPSNALDVAAQLQLRDTMRELARSEEHTSEL